MPMKEKLQNHYLKIGPRRFVVGAVIMLIITDILNGLYFKIYWVKNSLSEKNVLFILDRMKTNPAELNDATLLEIGALVDKSFDFFLFVILVNNLFFYLFYLRKKLWAQGYVLFYTFTALIFSFATPFMGGGMGPAWMIFNLLTIPFYIYLFLGIKLLKNETTLVPQKKAR